MRGRVVALFSVALGFGCGSSPPGHGTAPSMAASVAPSANLLQEAPCSPLTPACRKGIAAKGATTCVWSTSGLACWGAIENDAAIHEYSVDGVVGLAVGGKVACAITTRRTLDCFGDVFHGSSDPLIPPIPIADDGHNVV